MIYSELFHSESFQEADKLTEANLVDILIDVDDKADREAVRQALELARNIFTDLEGFEKSLVMAGLDRSRARQITGRLAGVALLAYRGDSRMSIVRIEGKQPPGLILQRLREVFGERNLLVAAGNSGNGTGNRKGVHSLVVAVTQPVNLVYHIMQSLRPQFKDCSVRVYRERPNRVPQLVASVSGRLFKIIKASIATGSLAGGIDSVDEAVDLVWEKIRRELDKLLVKEVKLMSAMYYDWKSGKQTGLLFTVSEESKRLYQLIKTRDNKVVGPEELIAIERLFYSLVKDMGLEGKVFLVWNNEVRKKDIGYNAVKLYRGRTLCQDGSCFVEIYINGRTVGEVVDTVLHEMVHVHDYLVAGITSWHSSGFYNRLKHLIQDLKAADRQDYEQDRDADFDDPSEHPAL